MKKADLKAKIMEEIMKYSLLTSEQFWQYEKGQLISDKVLYQMMDLCDDDKALSPYTKHIWVQIWAN